VGVEERGEWVGVEERGEWVGVEEREGGPSGDPDTKSKKKKDEFVKKRIYCKTKNIYFLHTMFKPRFNPSTATFSCGDSRRSYFNFRSRFL
jgi:hypothetical protein